MRYASLTGKILFQKESVWYLSELADVTCGTTEKY